MNDTSALTATRYLAGLLEMLAERDIDTGALLAESGLDPRRLADPGGFADRREVETLVRGAHSGAADPLLGLHLGRRLNLSAHGIIGLAGLTARDTRQAIELAVRFFPLVTSLIEPQLVERKDVMEIRVHPLADLDHCTEQFLVQTLVSSIDLMASFLLGERARTIGIQLAGAPRMLAGDPSVLSCTLDCNASVHCIRIPAGLLDIPFALADTASHQRAVAECRRELGKLEKRLSFTDRLYRRLVIDRGAVPEMEEIATEMHISTRTLHRRLAAEGSSYRELAGTARIRRACRRLGEGRGITRTAHELGYRDSANFTRAFRRHTGMTPSQYLLRGR